MKSQTISPAHLDQKINLSSNIFLSGEENCENNPQMAGLVGLAVHLAVWTLLFILTPGRVGISRVVPRVV